MTIKYFRGDLSTALSPVINPAVCQFSGVIWLAVNVNVEIYSLKSTWVQQTSQFTCLQLVLSYTVSIFSSGENSAHFPQVMSVTFFFQFSFHQVPITAGWTEVGWYERFLPNAATHEYITSSSNPWFVSLSVHNITWPRIEQVGLGMGLWKWTAGSTQSELLDRSTTKTTQGDYNGENHKIQTSLSVSASCKLFTVKFKFLFPYNRVKVKGCYAFYIYLSIYSC